MMSDFPSLTHSLSLSVSLSLLQWTMEQFEQLLTCCVCLDRYRIPKLLPCQHSFCMEPCMEGLVDYVRRQVRLRICHISPSRCARNKPINHNHCECISSSVCVWVCLPACVRVCEAIWVNAAYLFSDYVTWQARKLFNKSLGKSPNKIAWEGNENTKMCPKASKKGERTQYSWNSRWVFPFLFFLRRICVDLALRCWKIIKFTYKSCILIYMYYIPYIYDMLRVYNIYSKTNFVCLLRYL